MYEVSLTIRQSILTREREIPEGYRQDACLTFYTLELANKLFGDFREPVPKPELESGAYVTHITGRTPSGPQRLEKFLRDVTLFLPNCFIKGVYTNCGAEFSFYAGA